MFLGDGGRLDRREEPGRAHHLGAGRMTPGGLPLYTADLDADAGAVAEEGVGRAVAPSADQVPAAELPGAPSSEPAPVSGL